MLNLSILKTNTELKLWHKQQQHPIIYVPTMGGLHRGHSELIQTATRCYPKNASSVLVSIFVNPLQFGPEEDFDSYPRDLDQDCEIARQANAQAIWVPPITEIFPNGPDSHFKLKAPSQLQQHLCGASRKGHFDGVATVICRLLKLVQPQVLVLGEKDWQQFIIVRNLIKDLGLPVRLVGVPTVRDHDGLAYSSRNSYLSKVLRQKALALPQSLQKAAKEIELGREINLNKIKSDLKQAGLKVEYLERVDPLSLEPVKTAQSISLLAAAVKCGATRLIDHTFLMNRKPIVAIDGPAGAGKSTVTKAFAKKLGLLYLDTGAMYRAVTWLILKKKIDPENKEAISRVLTNLKLDLNHSQTGSQNVIINGNNVSEAIRSPEITSLVSQIATKGPVREALTTQQKALGLRGGLVAEGRDIGSAVFPDAELKVFLTASPSERARRRANDLKEKGFKVPDLITLEKQIEERDKIDSSREISPLKEAEGAVRLITDGLSVQGVVNILVELFRSKVPEEVWPTPQTN